MDISENTHKDQVAGALLPITCARTRRTIIIGASKTHARPTRIKIRYCDASSFVVRPNISTGRRSCLHFVSLASSRLNEPYNMLADESHKEQIPTYYAIYIEQITVIDSGTGNG